MQGHTQAVAMLSMAQQMLPANSGLRSMVGKFIPILEQHYDIAARLLIVTVRRQNQELGKQLSGRMMGGQQAMIGRGRGRIPRCTGSIVVGGFMAGVGGQF